MLLLLPDLFYGTQGRLQFALEAGTQATGFTTCRNFSFKVAHRTVSIYICRMAGSQQKIKHIQPLHAEPLVHVSQIKNLLLTLCTLCCYFSSCCQELAAQIRAEQAASLAQKPIVLG